MSGRFPGRQLSTQILFRFSSRITKVSCTSLPSFLMSASERTILAVSSLMWNVQTICITFLFIYSTVLALLFFSFNRSACSVCVCVCHTLFFFLLFLFSQSVTMEHLSSRLDSLDFDNDAKTRIKIVAHLHYTCTLFTK